MKISRRRKHNKRSKYTRHTKHGGGKHYKNKRTYRKHPRKLKHKSRLQRGGVVHDGIDWDYFPEYSQGMVFPLEIPAIRKVFYTFNGETQKQVIKIGNMALWYVRLTSKDLRSDDDDDASDGDGDGEEGVLTLVERSIEGNFSCEVVLMEIIVYPLKNKISKHRYKFMITLSDNTIPSEDINLSAKLCVKSFFDNTYETQLQDAIDKKKPNLLPNLPDIIPYTELNTSDQMHISPDGKLKFEYGFATETTRTTEKQIVYFPIEAYSNRTNLEKITDAISTLRDSGERVIDRSRAAIVSYHTA